jgi:mono/diheme cytochrome c family protein
MIAFHHPFQRTRTIIIRGMLFSTLCLSLASSCTQQKEPKPAAVKPVVPPTVPKVTPTVQPPAPPAVAKPSTTEKPHTTQSGAGKNIYNTYCLSCHQKDGSGVPGMYPPLQNSNIVTGDKDKLIHILLNGLEGEIEVNGDIYDGVMPKQSNLTDEQIANVLTYIRQNLGNKAGEVRMEEVAKMRGRRL